MPDPRDLATIANQLAGQYSIETTEQYSDKVITNPPKPLDVYKEMVHDIFSADTFRKAKKETLDFLVSAALTSVAFGGFFHATNTIGNNMDNLKAYTGRTTSTVLGFCVGVFVGLPAGLVIPYLYIHLVSNDHAEAVFIPVITNLASVCYEFGKKSYEGAKRKLAVPE